MFKLLFALIFMPMLISSPLWGKELDLNIHWYNRTIYRELRESFANPGNQVLKIPRVEVETDLRPTFSWESGLHRLQLDPRFIGSEVRTDNPNNQQELSRGELFLNGAFYQINFDEHQVSVGLQNYQWGPAEMLSPTNPTFRFLFDQRSLYFQQRGRNLVRWNWTINQEWNLVTFMEITRNSDQLPKEDQKFSPNGVLKLERSFGRASDYVGVVAGKTPYGENFLGEYAVYSLNDALSAYLDARHQLKTTTFFPGINGQDMWREESSATKVYHLGTAGIRHEGRVDTRIEYIYNGVGLDEKQWGRAQNSLKSLGLHLNENFKRFHAGGRDLSKRHYGYFSLRIPDLGKKNEYTLFVRHFNSLQDLSSVSQIQVDRLTGESFNLYLELANYQGSKDEDFSSLLRNEFSLGFRWSH